MRREFSFAIEDLAKKDSRIVFLTGDLGFMALENLSMSMGPRFINCGVAEQNMVGIAAGLAHEGFFPFIYSIAPFIVLRAIEQIRNDIGFHKLPACVVGNGGGYGYGIMGSSHHLLEDISCFRAMGSFDIYIPSFTTDIEQVVKAIATSARPSYLRLNNSNSAPPEIENFQSIRKLFSGSNLTVVYLGPLVSTWSLLEDHKNLNCDVFTVSHIGLNFKHELTSILNSIKKTRKLLVIEEHTEAGGIGELLSKIILEENLMLSCFRHIYANGYPSGLYGSQKWHQQESALVGSSFEKKLKEIMGF